MPILTSSLPFVGADTIPDSDRYHNLVRAAKVFRIQESEAVVGSR